MKGTYKCDGCTVIDPTVTVLNLNKNYEEGDITIVTVNMDGKNADPDIDSEKDGAEIKITDVDNPLPASTAKAAVKSWAENYLQRYKQ